MRYFACVVVAWFCFGSTSAQTEFGLKAGAGFSSMNDLSWVEKHAKPGIVLGLMANSTIGNRFFLQPEILFTSKGFRFKRDNSTEKGTTTFNYLSIPTLLGFKVSPQLRILAGPEFGYLQSVKTKWESKIYDATESYGGFDLSLNAGVQYRISRQFGAELRYSQGLVEQEGFLIPMPNMDVLFVNKGRHQSIQFTVYCIFQKTKKD